MDNPHNSDIINPDEMSSSSGIYPDSLSELHMLNRTLSAINNSNQAMMRAPDEEWLLNEVCRIIIEDCGHAMVWIGFAEDDDYKSVKPVAWHGFEEGYLDKLKISWNDIDRGRGPTGTSIRTGQMCMCKNMLTDPKFEPWRKEALGRGYASSIALPLSDGERAFGAITIYSRDPDPFSENEIKLLSELAGDLSYGIVSIRTRKARKLAESSLQESEDRFRTLSQATFEGIVISSDGIVILANEQFAQMHGYDLPEVIGRPISSFIIPADSLKAKDIIREGKDNIDEYRNVCKDGSIIFVEAHGRTTEMDGRSVRITVIRDITHRKKMEDALRQSEEKYRTMIETANEGIWQVDANRNTTYINKRFADMLGYTVEEMIELPWNYFVDEEGIRISNENLEQRKAGIHDSYEYKLIRKDGSTIWTIINATPLFDRYGNYTGSLGMITDITKRKLAEQALTESESSIRKKLDVIISPEGDIGELLLGDIIDSEAIQSLMNDFYHLAQIPMSIIDTNDKVLVGVGWQDICTNFHRANKESCKNCLESDLIITQGIPKGEFKLYKCKNNMWDMATPIYVGGKKMGNLFVGQFFFEEEQIDYDKFRQQAKFFGFNEDLYIEALDKVPRLNKEKLESAKRFFIGLATKISKLSYSNIKLARSIAERDNLLDELRKSEEKFFTTLSSVGDAVIATDIEGKINFMNKVAEELTGWTLNEAANVSENEVFNIINEHSHETVESPIKKVLETGNIVALANHTILIRKDGSEVYIDDSGAPIKDRNGNIAGVVLVFRDISERKAAEKERQALMERIESERSLLNLVIENTPSALLLLKGEDFRVEIVNNAYKQIAPGKQMENRTMSEIWPEVYSELEPIFRRTYETGEPYYASDAKFIIQRSPGEEPEESYFSWNLMRIKLPGEDSWAILNTCIETTHRVQMEYLLAESEERYRSLFSEMTEGFSLYEIVYDENRNAVNTRFIDVNPAFEELTGFKKESIIGKLRTEIFPVNAEFWINKYGEIASTGQSYSTEYYSGNIRRWYKISAFSPKTGLVAVLFSDITEQKYAEEALKQSEQREREKAVELATVLDAVPAAVWIAQDSDCKVITGNKFSAELLKVPLDSNMSKTAPEGEAPDTFKVYKDGKELSGEELPVQRAAKGEIVNDFELDMVYTDGSVRNTVGNAVPLYDDNGNCRGAVSAFIDITERKKAEELLSRHKARLERAQEMAHLGSWELNLNNNNLSWSDEVYRIFGLKPQEFKASYEAFLESVHPDDRQLVDNAYSGSLRENKDSYEIEHRIIRRDSGETRFVHEKCVHFRNIHGDVIRSVGMVHDISDIRMAEQEIRMLSRFPGENPNPVMRINFSGTLLYFNSASTEIINYWGSKTGDKIPQNLIDLIPGILKDNKPVENEIEVNGRVFILKLVPIPGANYINIYGRDITEQISAEKDLRESEEKYRLLFNEITEGFALHEIKCDEFGKPVDYKFLDINPAFERLTGLRKEDVINKMKTSILPDDDPAWIEIYGNVALTGNSIHFDNYSPALKRHYDVLAYSPKPGLFAVLFSDISDKKQIENLNNAINLIYELIHSTLHYEEVMQQIIVEAANALNADLAACSLFEDDNWYVRFIHGFPEDVLGMKMTSQDEPHAYLAVQSREVIVIDDAYNDPRVNRKRMKKWNIPSVMVIPLMLGDQSFGVIFINYSKPHKFSQIEIDFAEKLTITLSLAIKNTELFDLTLKREQELKISEERFRLALSYSPIAVFTQDKELRYTWIYQSIFNIPNEYFIGKRDEEVFSSKDVYKINELKIKVLETKALLREKVHVNINDKDYHFDLTIEPVFDNNGVIEGLACASVDITELVQLEADRNKQEIAQLIEKSSRLASLGVVAGGITHEINQPLNAIRIGSEGILFWNKRNRNVLPEIVVDMMTGISDGVKRIDEIIKSIRSFWLNTGKDTLERVNINNTVQKVISFNSQKLNNHNISLKLYLDNEGLFISVNELRLELVLNNLFNNAIHALDKTRNSRKFIKITTSKAERQIIMLVEDNGIGLPDVPIDRLFDPFFTTKEAEEGSGLGLAIAKMFLEKYHASITAYNNEEGGATFKLVFNMARVL